MPQGGDPQVGEVGRTAPAEHRVREVGRGEQGRQADSRGGAPSDATGEDAQGEAVIYVEYNRRSYRGSSLSTNIVESSSKAFLEVVNRIELSQAGARLRDERTGAARVAQAAV